MTKPLKGLQTRSRLLLLIIFLSAVLLRFYNFPNRVTFWNEQARSLMTSAGYLVKPTFLGQEYYRQDSSSHTIFSGATFNYSLLPLILIFNYNVIPITGFFALLNLATGAMVYILVKKIFDNSTALTATALFLFNDLMIYHSLFIWNYNYLPLVGLVLAYFLWVNYKKPKYKYIFLIGLFSGLGVSLQILFIIFTLIALVVGVWKAENKFTYIVLFGLGFLLGNFPMFIFDIRHDFYNSRAILQYLADTLQGRNRTQIAYYYFLPLWPIVGVFLGWVISRFSKVIALSPFIIVLLYIFFNVRSPLLNFRAPTGMPAGLTVAQLEDSALKIANDKNDTFNVASVLDFDKRAYVLRYLLTYVYGKKPMDVEDYPFATTLYVLSWMNYNFKATDVWEIRSGGSYNVSLLSKVNDEVALYKLDK